MKILDKYIVKEIIPPFFLGFFVVIVIFLLQFFIGQIIPKFIGKGLDTIVILELLAHTMPAWMALAIPIGVLSSTILVFSKFSSTSELIIMQACGISIRRLMIPVLFFGIITTVITERVMNFLLPDANHYWKILVTDISRMRPTIGLKENEFVNLVDGFSILVKTIDTDKSYVKDVTIYDYSDSKELSTIIADSAWIGLSYELKHLVMRLYHGEIHLTSYDSKYRSRYKRIEFEEYKIVIEVNGLGLDRSDSGSLPRGDRELSAMQLKTIADKYVSDTEQEKISFQNSIASDIENNLSSQFQYSLRDSLSANELTKSIIGRSIDIVDNRKNNINRLLYIEQTNNQQSGVYMVEFYKKYAISISALLFALLGVLLGSLSKKGGMAMAATFSLVFYNIHWIGFIVGEKLADRQLMSPFFSMFMGNILTLVLIIFLMMRTSGIEISDKISFLSFLFRKNRK